MKWHRHGNPWFIGVVGSIPSGLLVNWLTGLVIGGRENREYLRKVNEANREIVYALRPGISEGTVPTAEVLLSLINATARRHGVETSDIYKPVQVGEELVKEVMDSSFISSAQKAEYCARLATLGGISRATVSEPNKVIERRAVAEYRQRSLSYVSTMLGVVTACLVVSIPLLGLFQKQYLLLTPAGHHLEAFLPVLGAVGVMMTSLVAVTTYRDTIRLKRREEEARYSALRFAMNIPRPLKRPKPPEV